MIQEINESKKLMHPYYKIMELSYEDLSAKTEQMSRTEIIDWLQWNDSNGIYTDELSMKEFGNTLTKKHAVEIMIRQIFGDNQ
ncbi:MAG: hypothetical protein IPH61_04615 [Bacteroidetes bacterium]|nr:hypothetical protein [Bacteroidota bacterium]